ncbi:hypothetical protein LshimejAT787_0703930 [Lyophyllum shimeji]|uniref:RNase III domain-containing protein n=1 Tax=Lyophyllum shimeji TaxID=47721 RepID=A0A9P3PPW4_LYOSH|nr:hypothetical protein LshimejAT787_0703930 [Lyophyllum shimeji]
MTSRQRRRRASLTAYLNSPTKWSSKEVALPSLPSADLRSALNSRKHTQGNNDVLEFIGDRVVNLACALMAAKAKQIPGEQAWLARRLSNNDTLGRIAYQLRLHRHARLDPTDRLAADSWTPARAHPPPKLFADLFESYVGALYTHHGWTFTHAWLRRVYTPVLAAAARDVFFSTDDHALPARWLAPNALPWRSSVQRAFEAFMDSRRERLRKGAEETLTSLPRVSVSGDAEATRVEIATQLLKLWICDIAQRVFPELKSATQGGAHFLSMVTRALMSDLTLGYLSALLSLSACLPPSDPDFLSSPSRPRRATSEIADSNVRIGTLKDPLAGPRVLKLNKGMRSETSMDMAYRAKLACVLKARIGAYCLQHPVQGRKWGRVWIAPLVQWVMDALLARDGGRMTRRWRPATNLQATPSKDAKPGQDKKDSQPKNLEDDGERTLNALLNAFNDLDVGTARRRSAGTSGVDSGVGSKSRPDAEAKKDAVGSKKIERCTVPPVSRPRSSSRSKPMGPHTIKIKLGARWTAAGDDGATDTQKEIDTAALDPYRLIDEGDAFPAPLASGTPSEAADRADAYLRRAQEPQDDTPWITDENEDSGTDMEFSSCGEDSGSDMEFSSCGEDSGSDMEFSSCAEESGSDMQFSTSEGESGSDMELSSSSDGEDVDKAGKGRAPEAGAEIAQTDASTEGDPLSEGVLQSLARLDLGPDSPPAASRETPIDDHEDEDPPSPCKSTSSRTPGPSASTADAESASSEVSTLGFLDTNIPVKFRKRKVTGPILLVKTSGESIDEKRGEAPTAE